MKVTFYNYRSEYDGYRCQYDVVDKVEYLNKKEVMALADLRHPVLNAREYYDAISHDYKGLRREKFELPGSTYNMIVEPYVNPPKNK